MRFLKKLKPRKINQFIFRIDEYDDLPHIDVGFDLDDSSISRNFNSKSGVTMHRLLLNNSEVFSSNTFLRVHLMKLLGEYGAPVIGDCYTNKEFRGQSIYPYMLQHIIRETLKDNEKIFILVSPNNHASIKGIEKAGFKFFCEISTLRIGFFYLFTRKSFHSTKGEL